MSRTTEFIVHVNLKVILHVQCVRLKQNGGLMFGHCGDAVRLSREKMWMKRLQTIQPHGLNIKEGNMISTLPVYVSQ